MLSWLLQERKDNPNPTIQISPSATMKVEVQPRDPHTASQIIITAFPLSGATRILRVKVEWSRRKVENVIERISDITGNTYACEPSDIGAIISARVQSLDDEGYAEVKIGPIKIDILLKRLIDGALYSSTLLSQVILVEKSNKKNATLRITPRTLQFKEEQAHEQLIREYSMSEPRVELHPKDPTRVYFRFELDTQDEVKKWMEKVVGEGITSKEKGIGVVSRNKLSDGSMMSEHIPHSMHSSTSSKYRLFQKDGGGCRNKIEVRFLSRNSRDLFLFTQRAFVCRQDMKNSVYLQRIETLTSLSTEEDYQRFLEFMSLKLEICRLAAAARDLQLDRDAKLKDLMGMQESIGEMTATYLKIIEGKANIDIEQSYSRISHTREEVLGNKNKRELKEENQSLKQKLREASEEMELLRLLRKDDNQSVLNHTSNPLRDRNFHKRVSNEVYEGQNYLDISMNYVNVLEENNRLKAELKSIARDNSIDQLLQCMESTPNHQIKALKKENAQLRAKLEEGMENSRMSIASRVSRVSNIEEGLSRIDHSMNSEAELQMLQDRLNALQKLNEKYESENSRLRKERDFCKNQLKKKKDSPQFTFQDISEQSQLQNTIQQLQNERNLLLKKIESLTVEARGNKKQINPQAPSQLIGQLSRCKSEIRSLQLQLQKSGARNKQLKQENELLKRSSSALNRSRDLSMDMESYLQEKAAMKQQQIDGLLMENENISRMCEKYLKDAKEAQRELRIWKEKAAKGDGV